MQDSIGGNCKAVIIANVSAAEEHASHTAHTLAFARRAKNIVNKVDVVAMKVALVLSRLTFKSR